LYQYVLYNSSTYIKTLENFAHFMDIGKYYINYIISPLTKKKKKMIHKRIYYINISLVRQSEWVRVIDVLETIYSATTTQMLTARGNSKNFKF